MDSKRLRRWFVNSFIAVWLCVTAIDALPSTCTGHRRLKDWLDPYLDATGLWQMTWQLFAPEPDSINVRLKARVFYDDGTDADWNSPDWQNSSTLTRFVRFRRMAYFERARRDENQAAWPHLADFVSKNLVPPNQRTGASSTAKPVAVILTREWVEIKPPVAGELMPLNGDWSTPATADFYSREYLK